MRFIENKPITGNNITNLQKDFVDFYYITEQIIEKTVKPNDLDNLILVKNDIIAGIKYLMDMELSYLQIENEEYINIVNFLTNIYAYFNHYYYDEKILKGEKYTEFHELMSSVLLDNYKPPKENTYN